MICKVCNAAIDDTATFCSFCGSPVAADVDPGLSSSPFPDPAAPSPGPVNLTKPSDPVQDAPGGQPQQDVYGYGNGDTSYQQHFNQTQYSGNTTEKTEYEQNADNVLTLGIIAVALSVVIGFCCCFLPGPIVGIVGLVKINKLNGDLYLLSEEKQKNVNIAKILCIISLVLGGIALIANILIALTGVFSGVMGAE